MRTAALTVAICCTAALYAADKDPYENLSTTKRIEAVRLAQVWAPVNTATLDLKAGPPMPGAFAPAQTISCDYFQKDSGGKTPKFWCRVSENDEVKVKYG